MQEADHYTLRVLLDVPIVIVVPNVRAQPQHISGSRRLDLSIAKEREPILVSIPDVVIFVTRLFDRLEEMDCLMDVVSFILVSVGRLKTYRAGPQVDTVLGFAVLEPTTALVAEDGALVELIEMGVDLI